MSNDDPSTYQPADPVEFDFQAAADLAAKFRSSAALVTAQQLPQRDELARVARADWQGRHAAIFDTRMGQCASDADRLAEAMRDAAIKVEQLVGEARREQQRRDRANEYLEEYAAWQERERERSLGSDIVQFFTSSDPEPEMPEMEGEPPSLPPIMDPNIGPRYDPNNGPR